MNPSTGKEGAAMKASEGQSKVRRQHDERWRAVEPRRWVIDPTGQEVLTEEEARELLARLPAWLTTPD